MDFHGRVERIRPFQVMALVERAAELEAGGRDVIHMEIGEPDFPCPQPIIEAGRRALNEQSLRYTPSAGLPALREAVAAHYAHSLDARVDPSRIIITPGASGALLLAAALLVGEGERVLMADPNYPCNRHLMALMGADVDNVSVGADSGWQLDAALVARHWQPTTRLAMLATPSNPTGHVLTGEALGQVAETVGQHGGHLLVDEIYQGLSWGIKPETALNVAPDAFVVNSFSKYFGMTGWRLGWLVAPPEAVEPLTRLAQNVFLAPSTPAQHAALAAFTPECGQELERRRQVLGERRDALLRALTPLGLAPAVTPQGAFYLWLDISRYSHDSRDFCARLLEEEAVAITPGSDFAIEGGDHHVRIAFTTDIERLEMAVARLTRFIARQENT